MQSLSKTMGTNDTKISSSKSLKTWSKFSESGVLKYTKEWYSFAKSYNAIFSGGLSLLENQFQRVADPVTNLVEDISHKCPIAVERLDNGGVACINAFENGVEKAHHMTSSISRFDMRRSISNFMVGCLDSMIDASENVIDYLSPDVRLVPHRSMSKDGSTQTTEDEDAEEKPPKSMKHVTIPESALSNKLAKPTNLKSSPKELMIFPIKYSAETLKFCLTWLKRKYVTSSKSTSTYPSMRKSTGRRKVKPATIRQKRKGIISFRGALAVFMKYTGLKAIAALITKFSTPECDSDDIFREGRNKGKDSKEKRKYSDLVDDDSLSESDVDPMNLEGYDSGEDRDWQPTTEDLRGMKKDMDDSLEYRTDEESFVEIQDSALEIKSDSKKANTADPTKFAERSTTKSSTSPSKKRDPDSSHDAEYKDSTATKGNEMSPKICEVMSKKSGIPLKNENKENTAPSSAKN